MAILDRCTAGQGDVAIGECAFGDGPPLWLGKREIAHFDGRSTLDVRLTKAIISGRRQQLAGDERVSSRKGTSDWIGVRVQKVADVENAIALVEEAIAANLSTASPGLPPTGTELARRRRFH